MKLLGYEDFDIKVGFCGRQNVKKYLDYLNTDSIKLINSHYAKDFEYFDYDMISTISTNISTSVTTSTILISY